jgi:hypothetical protein
MAKTTRIGSGRNRVIIGSIVGATLAGTALLPCTGWLVRQQARTLFFSSTSPWDTGRTDEKVLKRQREAAAARPADFPLQMALALRQQRATPAETESGAGHLAALRQLESDHAGNPSLYAAILRELSFGAVKLDHRMDQFELEPRNADRKNRSAPVRPADVTEWLRAAERGAEIDTDNAFFPLMRAAGLYAGHRDAEAVAEIKRAGTLSRYDDYVRDEAAGGWTLAEAGQNDALPSLSLVAISAATRLPHYAVLRACARLTAVQAVHRETEGDMEEGFAIRRALLRCGARMRTDSSWLIGNMVGEAIAATAQARPGGAPARPRMIGAPRLSGDERAALRVKEYEAYLAKIGHPEEIAQVRHEESARKEIHLTVSQGLDQGPSSLANLLTVLALWAGGIALMGNTFWMVIFGAAATWLARRGRIRNGEALPPAVTWGFGLSAVPIAAVAAGTLGEGFGGSAAPAVVAVTVLGSVTAAALCLRRGQESRPGQTDSPVEPAASTASSVGLGAATMAFVLLAAGLLYWTGGGMYAYASSVQAMMGFRSAEITSGGAGAALMRLLATAVTTAVPVLTLGILAIAGRVRRVPVSVGAVRGFARAALPLTMVLSLLYVATVAVTSGREEAARQAVRASVEHEGRACAAYTGRAWPTFAP